MLVDTWWMSWKDYTLEMRHPQYGKVNGLVWLCWRTDQMYVRHEIAMGL